MILQPSQLYLYNNSAISVLPTLESDTKLLQIATNSRCPLPLAGCHGNDGASHILLECTHAESDMKKQHIARHDAMTRMLIKGFTKGTKGSHYLIADVGTTDTFKDIGVHSNLKRVELPKFVLPDSRI